MTTSPGQWKKRCGSRCCRIALVIGLALPLLQAKAQSIINGSFSSGNSGWNGCTTDIGISWLFGGPSFSDKVASVNSGALLGLADDNLLCQTITSLVPGTIYRLSFKATRAPLLITPATVSVSVVLDGNAMETVVSRTGGWNLTTTNLIFTANATSHTLTISPNFVGLLGGMVIDDVALAVVSPLPISLLYFQAQATDASVDLAWATASEMDNALFNVERSADLEEWQVVDEQPGAGNSEQMLTYSAVDRDPLRGLAYYRLRQTDTDGRSTVSEVRSVQVDGPLRLRVHPNPAHDRFVLTTDDAGGTYYLVGPLGRRIGRPVIATAGTVDVGLEDCSPGLYHVCSDRTGQCVALVVE